LIKRPEINSKYRIIIYTAAMPWLNFLNDLADKYRMKKNTHGWKPGYFNTAAFRAIVAVMRHLIFRNNKMTNNIKPLNM
jgi:hypothetical protein